MNNTGSSSTTIHVAMFPWFAMGHIAPYIHLTNELVSRGHKVSFLLPKGTQPKAQSLSRHHHLITFHPLIVPHVDGLPAGAETAIDAPFPAVKHLFHAFDRTLDQVKSILAALSPDFVFFDLAHWIPALAHELRIRPIVFHVASAAPSSAALFVWTLGKEEAPPHGYPLSSALIPRPEHFSAARRASEYFGDLVGPGLRIRRSMQESTAVALWSCREIEAQFAEFLQLHYQKSILPTGPLLRRGGESISTVEDRKHWQNLLSNFSPKSVVYCAFGSEFTPAKDQFRELLLGLELCGRPFLVAATKPPRGCSAMEESFPDEGFAARVEGRGIVHCGWVPQVEILGHESVGCFVSHCGSSSMWEGLLLSDCRIVVMPNIVLQSLTAMFMAEELKVAVEVEREGEEGWISKEGLSRAIGMAMDEGGEVGGAMKRNHDMYRGMLTGNGIQDGYTDDFVSKLRALMDA